jgi:hypothetical protein
VPARSKPDGSPLKVTPASLEVDLETNLPTQRVKRKSEDLSAQIDPGNDGWDTEVASNAIERQFEAIGKVIARADDKHLAAAQQLATAEYLSDALRPTELTEVWKDQGLSVFRPAPADRANAASAAVATSAVLAPNAKHQGPPGFAEALRSLASALREAQDVWVKFKVFRVTEARPAIVTHAYYQAAGRTAQGVVQQGATWRCRWRLEKSATGQDVPRIERIDVTDYEESVSTAKTLFSDCTQAALAGEPAFEGQLKHGLNHWVQRLDRSYRTGMTERYGMAMGDANGDDLEDVYVCQPVGIPNRLLVQQPDGTFRDQAAAAGVDFLDHTSSALLVDLDNDGDQDLVVATLYRVLFLTNDGQGRFALGREQVIKEWDVHALSAADYDSDGDLDVLLTIATGVAGKPRGAYFDAHDGGGIMLFRNDIKGAKSGGEVKPPDAKSAEAKSADAKSAGAKGGDVNGRAQPWTFTEVTAEVGFGKETNDRQALAAAWVDYDDDGDVDLYVANDFGPNDLWRNDGGKFVNVAQEARVEDFGSGMSVSGGDFNRDGRMDLYVGNMFSSAGNRIVFQTEKMRGTDAQSLPLLQRFAKGNSLFQNLGGGRFQEVSNPLGVEMGRWAWSSLFVDVNNDGWEDLFVVNGYVTNDNPDDL